MNYYWDPAGAAGQGRDYQRTFTFADPGKHIVKVRLEIAPFKSYPQPEKRLMLKRGVEALVDIDVQGGTPSAAPANANIEHPYGKAKFTFYTPDSNYTQGSVTGSRALLLGTEVGFLRSPADCLGRISGTTFSCSARETDPNNSNLTRTVKCTFVLSPTGDTVTSFSYEADAVYEGGTHWTEKVTGVNVPFTVTQPGNWAEFSVIGTAVCKQTTGIDWNSTWSGGSAKLLNYSCTSESKLVIDLGFTSTGAMERPSGLERR